MAAIPNITSWLTVFSLQTCNLSNGDEREKMACILIEKIPLSNVLPVLSLRHNDIKWSIKVHPAMQF